MGKQTRFFFTKEEEDTMINNLVGLGYIVMGKNGTTVSDFGITQMSQLYISYEGVQLSKREEFVDTILSEVITLTRTKMFDNNEVNPGRVWYENKFFNKEGKSCNKSKKIEIIYKKCVGLIKLNSSMSKCKDYYISDGVKQKVVSEGFVLKSSPITNVEF